MAGDSPTPDDELLARNRELEAIFRAIPDLLFELAPDRRIVNYRAGSDDDLYVQPDAFLGRTMAEVLPAGAAGMLNEALGRIAAGERHATCEYDLQMPGQIKWFEARIVPLEGGNVILWVRDITERRRAQEERLHLERKLLEAQRLESLGVLAGGIAHDFNNLLAVIIGGVELVARSAKDDTHTRRQLDNVGKAAWRASELSRQLLAYAGKGDVQRKYVDFASLVRDTAQLLEAAISKRVRLVLELAAVPSVYADVAQLRQVLMNLITNASDALGDRDGVITVRLRESGGDVELEVEDDGSGMDEQTRHHMFDPFFTTKGPGRGLGLAAVVGIVRAHDGQLAVHSVLGHGTRITMSLPGTTQAGQTFADTAPVGEATVMRGTALVVDDEPAVRDVTARLLTDAGLTVVTAKDGREAVDVFVQHGGIDVAVIDMTMPNLRGDEVFRELRRADPDVGAVLTSGYDEAAALQLLSEDARPPEFVAKPFTLETMLRAVTAALAARAGWKRSAR